MALVKSVRKKEYLFPKEGTYYIVDKDTYNKISDIVNDSVTTKPVTNDKVFLLSQDIIKNIISGVYEKYYIDYNSFVFATNDLNRSSHIYVICNDDVSKSTLDITSYYNGVDKSNGMCVIDIHPYLSLSYTRSVTMIIEYTNRVKLKCQATQNKVSRYINYLYNNDVYLDYPDDKKIIGILFNKHTIGHGWQSEMFYHSLAKDVINNIMF